MIHDLPADSTVNVSQGLDKLVEYTGSQVSNFTPMMLFAVFMITFLGGMYKQTKSEGRGHVFTWLATASFITFGLALILSLGTNLISQSTLVTTLVITITFVTIYLFSNKEY